MIIFDLIFLELGFVNEPKLATNIPCLSSSTLLKFQTGLKLCSLANHLKKGCASFPLTLVIVVIGSVNEKLVSQKFLTLLLSLNSWKKSCEGMAKTTKPLLENSSCNFCSSLYCLVKPQLDAVFVIKTGLPLKSFKLI